METAVVAVMWLVTLAAALYGLHRLTLPPANRSKPEEQSRFGTAVGSAMADLHALLKPGARPAVEIRHEQRKQEDGSGEPPSSEGGNRPVSPPPPSVE